MYKIEADSVMLDLGGRRVLQDVYICCETGHICGILGRNGSGKSSLLRIIYGDLRATDQSVRIEGEALLDRFRRPEEMRYLPQHHFIPKSLILKAVLDDFELEPADFFRAFPGFDKHYNSSMQSLSGGERRVLELYAVLMSHTRFCLLDEPFSHIMPLHVDTFKELLTQEKANKGILLTDHQYRHVTELSDVFYLISQGKTHRVSGVGDLERLGYVGM